MATAIEAIVARQKSGASLSRAIFLGATVVLAGLSGCSASHRAAGALRTPGAVGAQHHADPVVRHSVRLGHSVRGRPISAVQLGDPDSRRSLLLIGCVDGDEPGGIAIAKRILRRGAVPREAQVWVLKDLNPDGVAMGTRQNAHAVDLNRNFPWRWRPIGHPGNLQYSGPRPLSEPESRIARSLILRVRPRVTIWFHQPLDVVDLSGGRRAVERRFARLTHMPLEELTRYPGSAASWQDHRLRGTTAFVTELPGGALSAAVVARDARAVLRLVASGA